MERRGWVNEGASMWVGDTSSAIDVFTLTREGRQELKRQNPDAVTEPLTLTREKVLDELERALGAPRRQLEMNPTLRAARFHYWPSSGHAWLALPDDT
jgi:hypothetical protein